MARLLVTRARNNHPNHKFRLVKWTGRVIGMLMLLASVCQAAPQWIAPTNAVGYNVYIGQCSGVYQRSNNVGNVTNYTQPLAPGAYWVVVAAYNSGGESDPSNEILLHVPVNAVQTNVFVLRLRESTNMGLMWVTNYFMTLTNVSASAWFQLVCEVAQRFTPNATKQKAVSATVAPPQPPMFLQPILSPKAKDK